MRRWRHSERDRGSPAAWVECIATRIVLPDYSSYGRPRARHSTQRQG